MHKTFKTKNLDIPNKYVEDCINIIWLNESVNTI